MQLYHHHHNHGSQRWWHHHHHHNYHFQGAGEGILEFLTPKWADFENYDVRQFPAYNEDEEVDNTMMQKDIPNIDMFV